MTEEEFLSKMLLDDRDAVIFCQTLGKISQVWDDLIDRDAPVSDAEINQAFVYALVRLPTMPFYVENFGALQPLIKSSIVDWITANELEKGDNHDRTLAYVLRDALTGVVIACADIVGGFPHAVKVSVEIRRFFHRETLEEYLKELKP